MSAGEDEESALIAAAVREAYEAAGFDPAFPPSGGLRPAVRPVPLEQMLFALQVVRHEVPRLTQAAAAAALDERERQANRFAAELLMPESLCRGLYQFYDARYGNTPRFIEGHVAGDLLVSRQAVRRRLADLGLTAGR